jgi:hypothetical protein
MWVETYFAFESVCQIAKGFPCGSVSIANQPIPGIGDFPFITAAPSFLARSIAASNEALTLGRAPA